MIKNRARLQTLISTLVVLILSSASLALAGDAGDEDVQHRKVVRKIVINCDEDSGEDCEQEIRVEAIGEDGRVFTFGDAHKVWFGGGPHGSHYAYGSAFDPRGGFLGVQLTELTPELRTHFGVDQEEGVMISKVVEDSAAFRAGLTVGDIITRVEGEPVGSGRDLMRAVRSHEEGETVILEIWRQGGFETLSATLDKHPQLEHFARRIQIDCDEDEEDCGIQFFGKSHSTHALDCPDGEDCEIKIDCDGGDCECWMNGDPVDCQELHTEQGHGR